MASTSLICDRNLFPNPSPLDAPSTSPAISVNSNVAGMVFFGLYKFSKNVTQNIHYLIIGSIGSDDWIHSSFGRKIEKALQFKKQGKNIIIISEDHWTKYI